MTKFITCLVLFIAIGKTYSQKEDYYWIGGYQGQGTMGFVFDFNDKDNPKFQTLSLGFAGNNTSICDKEGNLLFYFNGCAVLNRRHQVMPNGDSINAGIWFDKFWRDCRYGYPGFQECIILNDPLNYGGFYLIHTTRIYYQPKDSAELNVTYIDMKLDNNNGDVLYKNKRIYSLQNLCNGYLTAIKHKHGENWWVIQPLESDSIFLTYKISENGIERVGNQNTHQYFDRHRSNSSGTAKFSPNGSKYAL